MVSEQLRQLLEYVVKHCEGGKAFQVLGVQQLGTGVVAALATEGEGAGQDFLFYYHKSMATLKERNTAGSTGPFRGEPVEDDPVVGQFMFDRMALVDTWERAQQAAQENLVTAEMEWFATPRSCTSTD